MLHVAQHATVLLMVGATEVYVLAGALAAGGEKTTLRDLANELQLDHTLVHRAPRRALRRRASTAGAHGR